MLSFDQAQKLLIDSVNSANKTESIPLNKCYGRILANPIVASIDLPPADNSAMDGYAIRFSDYVDGKFLPIQQHCYAGDTPQDLKPNQAIRLFTGSIMPAGADTVVMQEYATIGTIDGVESVCFSQARNGANVRKQGEDVAIGKTIVDAGTTLGAGEIALIASQGIDTVDVYQKLSVGILTTGDELVQPGQSRLPEQIYNSNSPMLASMLEKMGANVTHNIHAPDTKDAMTQAFNTLIDECDLVISVGGVSVGDKDLVKPTIESLGGSLDLWRVSMKPGKPVALASARNKPIVCLPGNPVSAYVVFIVLVSPMVRKMQGHANLIPAISYAKIDTDRQFKGSRDDFIRVQATYNDDGSCSVKPYNEQGSAIISAISWASGIARIPANAAINNNDLVAYYDFKHWC